MRLKISSMTDGRVDAASLVPCSSHESDWLATYESVSAALVDSSALCIHHMVLVPKNGQGSALPHRAVWTPDDHPDLFDMLGGPGVCEGVEAERVLVLSPSRAIPTTPVTELVVGSLAMDLAAMLSDVPEEHGFGRDVDAVLAIRAAIAALVVGAARNLGIVQNAAAAVLAAQIRRDFASALLGRFRHVEFNRTRVASDASPGLVSAVAMLVAEAVSSSSASLPLHPEEVFETASDLLRKYAPGFQDA